MCGVKLKARMENRNYYRSHKEIMAISRKCVCAVFSYRIFFFF